jgi:hypothetical protein
MFIVPSELTCSFKPFDKHTPCKNNGRISRSAIGHCGGTPHSCGSKPPQFNILPDKSGFPAETMRWIFTVSR